MWNKTIKFRGGILGEMIMPMRKERKETYSELEGLDETDCLAHRTAHRQIINRHLPRDMYVSDTVTSVQIPKMIHLKVPCGSIKNSPLSAMPFSSINTP
jgi:hypothetical protein